LHAIAIARRKTLPRFSIKRVGTFIPFVAGSWISERGAITTGSEKSAESLRGIFDPGEKLFKGMKASVFVAIRRMLMLRNGHTGAGCLADVQWRAITSVDFDW
jgi:hypothetical protein